MPIPAPALAGSVTSGRWLAFSEPQLARRQNRNKNASVRTAMWLSTNLSKVRGPDPEPGLLHLKMGGLDQSPETIPTLITYKC